MTTRFKSKLMYLFFGAILLSPIIVVLFLLGVMLSAKLGIIVIEPT